MDEFVRIPALVVAGIEIRTSNEQAVHTFPAHWQQFLAANVLVSIPDRRSDDLFATSTHFANEGLNNQGGYTFDIGAEVDPAMNVPAGLVRVGVPAGRRIRFSVPGNHLRPPRPSTRSTWT